MVKEELEGQEIPYLFKRITRSWKVFLALLLSIILASIFFCGANVGADTVARQTLDKELSQVPVDIRMSLYQLYSPLSMANITEIVDEIHDLDIDEITQIQLVLRDAESAQLPRSNKTVYFKIVGISENSQIYDDLKVLENGSSSLGVNETYVWAGSKNFEDLKVGDMLRFNVTLRFPAIEAKTNFILLNLKVVGLVDPKDQVLRIIKGDYSVTDRQSQSGDNILIVSCNKTFAKIVDTYYHERLRLDTEVEVLFFLDRRSVINPWNIDAATERISVITSQIRNIVSLFTHEWVFVYNYLDKILANYKTMAQGMRIQFIITALPVFFIAWYMGTTVSDVSYNLRRREIGILLTKGFSNRQLLRMFLSEALLIGLIGGMIGIGLSLIFIPFFVQSDRFYGVTPVIGMDTIIFTVVFSTGLSLLSVFQPARRASKLDIVDALQEYRYVEEVKPYKKKWPLTALILGSYKIATWLLGINSSTLITRPQPMSNILGYILISTWASFDTYVLNFLGPLLFFWGFTKIFIHGSLKFQEFVTRIAKPLGDLWTLSIKNIRRNPARAAGIAFLTAMIVGYSFQTVGSYSSEEDYVIRNIRLNVGSDVSVQMSTLENLSSTADKIRKLPGVSAISVEYRFFGRSADGRSMTFLGVDPKEWLNIAQCESDLFVGGDVVSMFQEMQTDKNTIILENGIARALKLSLGDKIVVKFDSNIFNLRVVGFLVSYWTYGSYVPNALHHSLVDETRPSGKILVKLLPSAEGEEVAEKIRNLQLSDVSAVYSVDEILEQQRGPSGPVVIPGTAPLPYGSIEIQRLGIAFAVVAASLGVALVTLTSLTERRKEVSLLSVRGLSSKQIVGVLLTENLAVVAFAVFLGSLVGVIVVQGHISSLNSVPSFSPGLTPILRHMVFPLGSMLTLTSCFIFVFASSIIPVLITVRRYFSESERFLGER